MIGKNLEFCGRLLSDFGMIMVAPETEQQFISREIIKTEQSSVRPVPNHFGTKYSDTLPLNFLIVKNPCNNNSQSEMILKDYEINNLRSWLEYENVPRELIVYQNDEEDYTYYYGIFNEIQPYIVAHECLGLYLTFTCKSPYGYSSPITYATGFLDGVNEKVLKCVSNSADRIPLKPTVIIYPSDSVFKSDSYISIVNRSDNDKEMKINIPTGIEYIKIDCKNKTIVDHNGKLLNISALGWKPIDVMENSSETYNIYWLQLYTDVNDLFITKTGNVAKVEITTQFVRKVDGF